MAYCRFSSDDFKSDVYVYYGENGYVIHVSGRRMEPVDAGPPVTLSDPVSLSDIEALIARQKRLAEIVGRAKTKDIDHPDAGKTFVLESEADAINKLLELRENGFYVPEVAIETLREEASDG